MDVLFVADQIVPPIVNGSASVYHAWLNALAQRHRVTAIMFNSADDPTDGADAFLSEICKDHLILCGVPSAKSWKAARAASRYFSGSVFAPRVLEEWNRRAIKDTIRQFMSRNPCDVALFNKLDSIPLFGRREIERLPGVRILDLHDDLVRRDVSERAVLRDLLSSRPRLKSYPPYRHLRLKHLLSRLDVSRARRQERDFFEIFDAVLVSAGEEQASYAENSRSRSAFINVPWPVAPPASPADRSKASYDAGFIASDASFNLQAILYFIDRILPLIRERRPNFTMLVVGRIVNPLRTVLEDVPGVTFVERVDEVRDFYEQIKIAVTPLLTGTGVSLKTLEALAFGVPVVTTKVGARGLDVRSPQDLLVCDEPHLMAAAILDLLRNPDRREELGRRGRASVAARHSVDGVLSRFDEIVAACGRRPATPGSDLADSPADSIERTLAQARVATERYSTFEFLPASGNGGERKISMTLGDEAK